MDILSIQKDYPLINCNFLLRVDAVYDLPCKRINSFQMENEYETIQEGGINDYVHLRRKPTSRPFTFEYERYIGAKYFDPLPIGKQPELPIVLYVSEYLNNFEQSRRVFTFQGCTVTKKQYGDLDAEKAGLLLETTTVAYQQLLVEDY